MNAIILQTTSSFHVESDVAECLKGWGGELIVKNGNATSDVKDIGLAHVKGDIVSTANDKYYNDYSWYPARQRWLIASF